MFILCLVAFIDLIGFGMIFPMLPLFQEAYKLTDMEVGYLASSFALFGLLGSIIFGIISDKIGRKIGLYLPLVFASLTYFMSAQADSYISLLVLRSLTGFFTGNFSVAFAAASDLADEENKFKNMGRLGMSFSLGFILGPSIGGILAKNGESYSESFALVFNCAGVATLISALIALFIFKETLSKEDRLIKSELNLWDHFKGLSTNRVVLMFTYLSVLFSLALAGIEIYFSLWLSTTFNFNTETIGIYWGIFAIILTLSQLIFPKYLHPKQAIILGFILFTGAQFLIIFTNNLFILGLVTLLNACSMGMIFPSINVNLALQGSKNEQGLIFGINQSVAGVGRILGPYCLGIMYQINHNFAWLSTGLVAMLTLVILLSFYKHHQELH